MVNKQGKWWVLFEKVQVVATNASGQVTEIKPLGKDWFPRNEEPPIYEPDENKEMWVCEAKPRTIFSLEKPTTS